MAKNRRQSVSPAQPHYRLAKVLVEQEKWDDAISAYQQALAKAPTWVEVQQELGDLFLKLERWEDAVEVYEKVISQGSDGAQVHHNLGDALLKLQRWGEAVAAYEKAIELNPEFSWSYNNLGDGLRELQRWDQAAQAYRKAINLKGDFALSHHNLGDVLVKKEQWEEARSAYQKAIELEPNFVWSSYNLAQSFEQLGQWDDAVEAYRQALKIKPDFAEVEDRLNQALHQQVTAKLEQALRYYRQAIENDPTDIESYQKALEIKPDDAELYLGLGNAWVAKGEITKAIEAYQKAIQIQPNLSETHQNLLMSKNQDLQEDIKNIEIQSIVSIDQQLSSLPTCQGVNLDSEADLNPLKPLQSESTLTCESLTTDTEWQKYYEQGNKLQLEGKLEQAMIAYYQAILMNPNHHWSYHNLGDTHLKLGHWQEAITAYQKAIKINPTYFWSNYNLGVAYSKSKQWSLAVNVYRNSIKVNPALNLPLFTLKETLNNQWDSTIAPAYVFIKRGDREAADKIYKQAIQQYNELLPIESLTKPKEVPLKPSILLVVDDFLTQCLRYRVYQKKEQLEFLNFQVDFISQTEIKKAKRLLHFFHVVIFYRVPAVPDIIEIIKYAKAIKKVVFYEIDDFIFDSDEYPESFESYGGQITKDEYEGLCVGTVLFREAMALCDYGIASTPALAQEMKKVISSKIVFLHRNALDFNNTEFLKLNLPKVTRDYISIFYGTGTKAHNSDFNELAAPAIAQILKNYPQVRLTIVGYLTLPEVLLPYRKQIDQIAVIKDIKVYWDFLKQADINIAVLHPTKVNNCKSELKWFEAAFLGIPSVVSATQTYMEVVQHGVDGLIAKTTEEWYENLERLVIDEPLRISIAKAAYEKTVKNYSVPVMANNIQQIITGGIDQAIKKRELVHRSLKKKLLIVNVFYPPQSIGGGTRIVRDNVDILMKNYNEQYEIQVFTSDDDNRTPYQITEYIYNKVHVTKVSTPMREGMDWHYQDPEMYEIFTQYLKFNQPDLIHFHCVQRLTASVLEAAANLNIPYLVTVHDAWWISDYQFLVNEKGVECDYQQNDPLVVVQDSKNITESIRRRHYLRQRLDEASVVLVVSETFAELYRRNAFLKIRSNRNGIMPRPKLPRQPSATGRVRLAHIGGMAAHKGYFLLKQVVESTALSHLEFIVVNHAQAAGSISTAYWGTTPVKFINKIPQEQMPEFYSTIDILMAPSIWPESYGLVAREALAAGVWVVVSNKGALAEDLIPGLHGDVFNPDHPEELVAVLKKIDQNPEFYKQMVTTDFPVRTTEDQVIELQEIYQSISSRKLSINHST